MWLEARLGTWKKGWHDSGIFEIGVWSAAFQKSCFHFPSFFGGMFWRCIQILWIYWCELPRKFVDDQSRESVLNFEAWLYQSFMETTGELSSRFGDGTFLKELMLSATSQGYLSLRLPKYLGDHCSWNKIWWREHHQPHGDFFYQPPPTHKPLFGYKVGIVMKIWRGVSEAKIRELALEKSWMHEARTSEK